MGERQGEKKMEQSLHEAAIQGETASLQQILGDDPLILRRVMAGCFVHTSLHVAASEGHLEFVRQLLDNNKALARVLDPRRWSALHLAAANGHDKIVEVLVEANANMCLSLDGDGRNPLHLAAMEGHVSVLRVFFENNPHRSHELLKITDGDGNTILHLAIKNKKFEAMMFLLNIVKDQVKVKNIQKPDSPLNTINKCRYTALDILEEIKFSEVQDFKNVEKLFREVGAMKVEEVNQVKGESKTQDTLMMVATFIATMAFQVGLSPPGGVWQDNSPDNSANVHKAGEAVISYSFPTEYEIFIHANTVVFEASLATIINILIIRLFRKNQSQFIQTMMCNICLTVVAMLFLFIYSVVVITPRKYQCEFTIASPIVMLVWFGSTFVLSPALFILKRWLKVSWHIIQSLMKKLFMKLISPSSSQPLPTSSNGNEPQPAPA